MKTFDELWRDIQDRSQRWAIPIVQEYKELEHVFNLIKDYQQYLEHKTYLEVGTAEGNSLYVLSHALHNCNFSGISFVDYGESHTKFAREEVLAKLPIRATAFLGNSHNSEIIRSVSQETHEGLSYHDIVMIDAGHTYEDVIADAIAYGHLATKYIFFHDIQLPEVRKAFDWYCAQNPQFKCSEFINSTTYGYGILEV